MQHKDRHYNVPENVAIFEYLGTTLTNQNFMHEDIKGRLIRALLDTIRFRNLFILVLHLKTQVLKYTTPSFYLMWMLKLVSHMKGKTRVKVFKNVVFRKLFVPKTNEVNR